LNEDLRSRLGSFPLLPPRQTSLQGRRSLRQANIAHVEVVHLEEWRTPEPLSVGIVESVRFEALKRVPLRDQSKPFDECYVAPNRNRVMILRNDWIQIRVWPKVAHAVFCLGGRWVGKVLRLVSRTLYLRQD